MISKKAGVITFNRAHDSYFCSKVKLQTKNKIEFMIPTFVLNQGEDKGHGVFEGLKKARTATFSKLFNNTWSVRETGSDCQNL